MGILQKSISENASVTEKMLGQARPADTNAVSIYSPADGVVSAEITTIIVANTTGSAATFRLFLDDDGTTYDQTTALVYDKSLAANETSIFLSGSSIFMNNPSGNLAVRTGTNSALTFSVFGKEIKGGLN